jgi:hypothetical protein
MKYPAVLQYLDSRRCSPPAIAMLMLVLSHASAVAHPPIATLATVTVRSDGRVTVSIEHDPFAFAIGVVSEEVSDDEVLSVWSHTEDFLNELLQKATQRWKRELILRAGEETIPWRILQQPEAADFQSWRESADGLALPGAMQMIVAGEIPSATRTLSIRLPEILDQVLLVVERPTLQRSILPLDPGEESPPLDVSMLHVSAGEPSRTEFNAASKPSATWFTTVWRFMRLGFLHIVPFGVDHGLFVLGLFLMSPTWKSLFGQVTAFTMAHTLTMALASFSIVSVPSWLIEPLIALSILLVAIENLISQTPSRWRLGVCFIFGLVHGLGFATGLAEYGLLPQEIVLSLVAFTAGIETGHLAVLLLAFAVLGSLKKYPWYRSRVVIPLSIGMGAIALYWSYTRVF